MADLPVSWQAAVSSIDFAKLSEKVADFAPAMAVIKSTWERETLQEILQGKVFVPDSSVNEAVKNRLESEENPPLKELSFRSHGDRLEINAVTKKGDKIILDGEIEEFYQKDGKAMMVYKVKKHKLPGHGLTSWIFSRLSLSMGQKLFGKINIDKELPVTLKHNTVTLDFTDILAAAPIGQTELMGHKVLEMVEIENARPKDGGIEIDTKLNIPDDVKAALIRIIIR